MLTMTPRRRAIMWARTARVTRKAPVRQTPSTRSHVSSDISQTGSSLLMPALLKRMSTRPKRSRVARTIASTWSFCVTSTPKAGIGRPYSALILAATSWARRAWASETTTWAPSSAKRRATACPIPAPAAAVTIATRSLSFMGLSSLSTLRREDPSGRRKDAFRALSGCGGPPGRGTRDGAAEGRIALEGRHDALGEQAHVQLGLLVRHPAEGELGDQVVHARQSPQLGELLEAVVGLADDLDLDVELGRLLAEALVLQLGVGLRHLPVELVALDGGEVPVREVVVRVDRVPLAAEVQGRAFVGLAAALGDRDVREDDGRAWRVPDARGDVPVALDVLGGLGPLVLHDDQHAEAELRHDLGRLRAQRRGVEAPLGMGDRARAARDRRDIEILSLPVEDLVRERLDDDPCRLDEAGPRFLHRDAEPGVLDARRAAAESEEAAASGQDIEERDLLGDPNGIVPGQHDHRRPERDPPGPTGVIAQQLGRRRRHGVAGEVVLQREKRVEAERFGQVAERHLLGEDRGVGEPVLRQHVERDADFHDRPSMRFTG